MAFPAPEGAVLITPNLLHAVRGKTPSLTSDPKTFASLPPTATHPTGSPYGKGHAETTAVATPATVEDKPGLSVREGQSLLKPLRHSTPPPLPVAPCVYNRCVWFEKVM